VKKRFYILYIGLIMAILIMPFAGMSFWATDETTENRELSEFPSLLEKGNFNLKYLEGLGAYFEDHLAFRPYMLTINSIVWGKLANTSTTDQVVIGKEGWLYYGGTIDDYTGKNLLSNRELYDIVHNLVLLKDYVEQSGSRFLLMVAPNKNTLYDGNMPYYYKKAKISNLERLIPLLDKEGIEYIDLVKAFANEEDVLYFQRDTHWNNAGAVLVYNAVMDYLGKEHETYLNVPVQIIKDHEGDIDKLLYPLAAEEEQNIYFNKEWRYEYVNDVKDNMEPWIETVNLQKQGRLLMYRDSFGESLVPFFADEYGEAYFSRLVPYNMENLSQYYPDTVIVERVERKLAAFATEIPIMEGPKVDNIAAPEKQTSTTIETKQDGSYLVISGSIDEKCMSDNTDIYISVSDSNRQMSATYKAFYTLKKNGNGNGYQVYLKRESLPADNIHVNVIIAEADAQWNVKSEDITITWK
jgi:hypothetical protein